MRVESVLTFNLNAVPVGIQSADTEATEEEN
jgi:hypothetical protein